MTYEAKKKGVESGKMTKMSS